MKKYFNEFKKVDKGFLLVLLFAVSIPVIYSFLRLLWITDDGSQSYAMTSFASYIQVIFEIFMVFLIVPLFTYRKSEFLTKSNSMLIGIVIISFFMFLFSLCLVPLIYQGMINMNPDADKEDLLIYLIIMSLSYSLEIVEFYFISEIVIEKHNFKGMLVVSLGLLIKIVVDLLLISSIAVVDFTIVNVAISSLISSLIIIFVLFILFIVKQHRTIAIQKVKISEIMDFYKRGFYPGLDILIANFFYAFVTLKIVSNLSETGWNSWHLGMWIYWHIIFKITAVLKYSLLSESKNNEEIDEHNLTVLYCIFDTIIFFTLGPILSLTLLKTVVDDPDWLKLSTATSLYMIPFMLAMSIGDKLKIKMLNTNNYKYILWDTAIANFIIEFPVLIMLMVGIEFNYLENLLIWTATTSFYFVLIVLFYRKILNKEKEEKIYYQDFQYEEY